MRSATVSPETATFRRLGPYALLQLSGAGGMGRVDVALTTRAGNLTRLCVLKRMHSELRTPEEERRFRREAKIALRLSHGAIARTLDVEEIEGELCLLQEFVHGTNLAQLEHRAASREPLPVPFSIHVAREVARALAYAHSFDGTGIVHRDVTPDNIMLSFSGEVKLVDFGIAKSLGEQTLLTEVGAVVGRPIYTAPEIMSGGAASPRSDIYSLGVVLWQMLTGRSFPDRVLQGSPTTPSNANPAVTTEIDRVVAKAIEPDPARRYETADELQIALTRLLPAGFVGDRVLADFLAAHFPVETEKKLLTEDISRAQAQLAVEAAPAAAAPAIGSNDVAPVRPLPAPEWGKKRLVLSAGALAVAIAGSTVALHLRGQPSLPSPSRRNLLQSVAGPPSAPSPVEPAVPVVRQPDTEVALPIPSPSPSETPLEHAARSRAQARPLRQRGTAPTGSRGAGDLTKQAEERLRGGDLKMAYATAREAVRAGGGPNARVVLGRVLFAQSRLTLAEQEFAEVVRADPGNAEAARYLANVRREIARGEHP
jgi:serine/threonine-protein kinase